jgi:predicted SAM-dependent methyltransferase
MQLVNRYQRIVEKLLRQGTRRRHYYELVLRGIKVIENEGWRSFFRKVKIWLRLRKGTRGKQAPDLFRRYLESHQTRKLQIGCGTNVLEGWLNTDINPPKEGLFLDATKRLPFDDFTFHYIFCEHLIEHLEYQEGINLLRECFRILKPGGKLRIATPDIRFLIELYNPEKTELQHRYIHWQVDSFLSDIRNYQDVFVINNFFRAWGHKFIYDFKVMRDAMIGVGFTKIERYDVGESSDRNFENIERHGQIIPNAFNKLETFVVEGTKPKRQRQLEEARQLASERKEAMT